MAMIRPETEMKDSGVKYIGLIPRTWKIVQLKYCTDCLDGKRIPIDASLRKSGIYPYWGAGKIMDYVDDYIFDERLVLLGEDGAPFFDDFRPVSHLIDGKVWVNNHIHVLRTKDNVVDSYLVHALNSVDYHEYINGSILNKLTQSNMNRIKIPLPSYREQQAIADYLDETCSKIDEIIAEAKASIDEYKELRQGVIFEAVTKGLDKNVEMKSTSVGWIGTVPLHWRVAKIRQVAEFYNGDRSSKYPSGDDIVSEGIIFITSNNLGYIVLNTNISTNKFITKQKYDDLGGAKLRINDIVFCLRGSVGKCAINKTFDEGTIASSLVVIRAKKVDADYLNYVLQNHRITDEAIVNAIGIGSLNLAAHDISEFYMPIPPEKEMQDIVRYLDDKVGNVDDLISEKESLINDLEAYKKSLIYEVVTGKRRVV